jgi:hypothetical protein
MDRLSLDDGRPFLRHDDDDIIIFVSYVCIEEG